MTSFYISQYLCHISSSCCQMVSCKHLHWFETPGLVPSGSGKDFLKTEKRRTLSPTRRWTRWVMTQWRSQLGENQPQEAPEVLCGLLSQHFSGKIPSGVFCFDGVEGMGFEGPRDCVPDKQSEPVTELSFPTGLPMPALAWPPEPRRMHPHFWCPRTSLSPQPRGFPASHFFLEVGVQGRQIKQQMGQNPACLSRSRSFLCPLY